MCTIYITFNRNRIVHLDVVVDVVQNVKNVELNMSYNNLNYAIFLWMIT